MQSTQGMQSSQDQQTIELWDAIGAIARSYLDFIEVNNNNQPSVVPHMQFPEGKKDKNKKSKQIKRTQLEVLNSAPTTQSMPSQSNQVTVNLQQKLTTLTMKIMYICA